MMRGIGKPCGIFLRLLFFFMIVIFVHQTVLYLELAENANYESDIKKLVDNIGKLPPRDEERVTENGSSRKITKRSVPPGPMAGGRKLAQTSVPSEEIKNLPSVENLMESQKKTSLESQRKTSLESQRKTSLESQRKTSLESQRKTSLDEKTTGDTKDIRSQQNGEKYIPQIYQTIEYNGNLNSASQREVEARISHANYVARLRLVKNAKKMAKLRSLAAKVAVNNVLYVSVVDTAYAEMAINLFETSYMKFNIKNFLFVCMNQHAKIMLPTRAGECFVNSELITEGFVPSAYHSKAFNEKTKIKTSISLDLMLMGFTVIMTDLDLVFFKNPTPFLNCKECDLQILDNYDGQVNSGFYMVRPTRSAIALQQFAISNNSRDHTDQELLNYYAKMLYTNQKLKVKVFEPQVFQPGVVYYQNGNRYFYDKSYSCSQCVLVHNNYVKNYYEKVYRMKEMMLWVVDTNTHFGYYSCPIRKYLTYTNPDDASKEEQLRALNLAFAIAKLLKRTVIFPKFICGNHKCNFVAAFGIKPLLEHLHISYRESCFLSHPKVPVHTKQSVTPNLNVEFGDKNDITGDKKNLLVTVKRQGWSTLGHSLANLVYNDVDLYGFRIMKFTSLVTDRLNNAIS